MSIEARPGHAPVSRSLTRTWGELTPEGESAHILRFVLPDRVVTVLSDDIHRWEHLLGEPERLILFTSHGCFTVDGISLAELRAALDLRRLTEIRPNFAGFNRPGPRVRAITVESP